MNLTPAQHAQLLAPIKSERVGKDGKGFAHLEAYDVRVHLIRCFGFGGWSATTEAMELIFEAETSGKWTVAYRAHLVLAVGPAVYSEWAVGDAKNQPSRADAHDLAMKMAESQALKRCAVNLGDQFGLSLYRKGSLEPVVRGTHVGPTDTTVKTGELPDVPPVVSEEAPAAPSLPVVAAGEVEPPPSPSPASDEVERLFQQAQAVVDSDLTKAKKCAEIARLTGVASSRKLLAEQVNGRALKDHFSEFVSIA